MNYQNCEKWLKKQGVNCVSLVDQYDEGHFSYSGCECCRDRLGNTVYSVNGYNPTDKKVYELGDICGDCLSYFYNGVQS
jgi:hypothetical protein